MNEQTIGSLGSSPLARGLLQDGAGTGGDERIIPARAGFTLRHRPGGHEHRDHPRSRGVYPVSLRRSTLGSGSSPLARGLPLKNFKDCQTIGIIPARAGFTTSSSFQRLYPTDHPRSRGVYGSTSQPRARAVGSSPLARGLRERCGIWRSRWGIIPARAGFTWRKGVCLAGGTDHPRSRGVYSVGGNASE